MIGKKIHEIAVQDWPECGTRENIKIFLRTTRKDGPVLVAWHPDFPVKYLYDTDLKRLCEKAKEAILGARAAETTGMPHKTATRRERAAAKPNQAALRNNLRRFREAMGLSQAEFSPESGIRRDNLGAMETGARSVTMKTIRKMCARFDLDPAVFQTEHDAAYWQEQARNIRGCAKTTIRIRRLPGNDLPLPEHPGGQGDAVNLSACIPESLDLCPLEPVAVPTGISAAIPVGYELRILPGSIARARGGAILATTPDVIDENHHGEMSVILTLIAAPGSQPHTVRRGDPVARAMLFRKEPFFWREDMGIR